MSEEIPEAYRGREQSYVKHVVLERYLMRLLMIVGQQRANVIGYVDGFAGPWESKTEDMSDTSIGISLRTILDARRDFVDRGWDVPTFKALYIEKDPEAFARLEEYIRQQQEVMPPGVMLEAWNGDFLDLRDDIVDWFDPSDFVLFFIDPTGWTEVAVRYLVPLLRRENSEFLINMMYMFLNRFEDEAREFLGDGVSFPEEPLEREHFLVRKYRERLVELSEDPRYRSAYVRIKDRKSDRAKFHLVYLTRHHKGIVVFMTESEKAERDIQPAVRAQVAVRETGQTQLFSAPGETAKTPRPPVTDVQAGWLSRLSTKERAFTEEDLADLLEETDCFPGDVQEALGVLIDDGRVENLDAKRARPKNKVNFRKKERLRLLPED